MSVTDLKNKIVDIHLSQAYGQSSYAIPYDRIKSEYARFPNEAVYLIDCENAQLEPISNNFEMITGLPFQSDKLDALYEHIHKKEQEKILHCHHRLIQFGFSNFHIIPEYDTFTCVYKTINERVVLKNTTVLSRDSKGIMRYSIGKIVDVTNLVQYMGFRYSAKGLNSATMLANINGFEICAPYLSKREIEVLILISKGLNSESIANELYISKMTVETHRKNILKKLESSNSVEAYKKALEAGLLP